jgi:uncharacterized protein YbjT (DUF2867 family)
LSLPSRGGAIAWVDAGDIAAVAVAAMLSPAAHRGRAYTLTGPAAVTVADVAAELSAHLGHVVRAEDPPTEQAVEGVDTWTRDILVDLYDRVAAGGFTELSGDVERVGASPPTPIHAFIAKNAAHWRSPG